MKISEAVKKIKARLPIDLVADQDNVGLIIGDYEDECARITVAYELEGGVVNEAVRDKSDLIVTYHTPLYRQAKSFTSSGSSPNPLYAAARQGKSVFAVHTALDVTAEGLNFDLAHRLGLTKIKILSPLRDALYKLVVFVPSAHLEDVRNAMVQSGAGRIGDYTGCSFSLDGEGEFVPGEGATPFIGSPGRAERTAETRLEMVVERSLSGAVIRAMLSAHPYEEVAYDIYPILNDSPNFGFGAIGELYEALPEREFVDRLKRILGVSAVRLSHLNGSNVKVVALCAGSGVPFFKDAARREADIFITGDVKHHDFREARTGRTVLVDATHRATEKFSAEILHQILRRTFADKLEVIISKHEYDSSLIV